MSLPFNRLFAIVFFFAVMACEKEDVAEEDCTPNDQGLRIAFAANWEGEEFNLFENYLNITEYNVLFEQFKFYISEIVLVKENGEEVQLSEIELYDFVNDKKEKRFDIPAGDYQGLKFAWGVPVELNGTQNEDFDPTVYDIDHPLNVDNAMYWGWQPGYRFVVFEGRYDTTPESSGDIPESFSIHTGLDTCYWEIEALDIPFSFQEGDSKTITVDVDFEKSFYFMTDTIDLAIDDQSHGNNIQLALRLMRNIEEASTYSVE